MSGRRVRDQEVKSRKREERQRDRLERLEKMVYAQHEKLDRLEDLVYRVMHRDRVGTDKDLHLRPDSRDEQMSPPRRSETAATLLNPKDNESDDSLYSQTRHKGSVSANFYPIPNM
jgi:hypothetical protein